MPLKIFVKIASSPVMKCNNRKGVFMNNILNFLSAALPWISIGLLLAIFFAQNYPADERRMENRFYGSKT